MCLLILNRCQYILSSPHQIIRHLRQLIHRSLRAPKKWIKISLHQLLVLVRLLYPRPPGLLIPRVGPAARHIRERPLLGRRGVDIVIEVGGRLVVALGVRYQGLRDVDTGGEDAEEGGAEGDGAVEAGDLAEDGDAVFEEGEVRELGGGHWVLEQGGEELEEGGEGMPLERSAISCQLCSLAR